MIVFEGRPRPTTTMNIAPLIDVIFLLLLFFMLSSHFVTEPGIKITLPRSVTALPQRDTAVTVFIGADRSLHLDGEPVAAEALGAALAARLDGADERKVIIKADELVDLALAVMVMDMAKEAGADGLVVSTRAREADE